MPLTHDQRGRRTENLGIESGDKILRFPSRTRKLSPVLARMLDAPPQLRPAFWALYRAERFDRDHPVVNRFRWPS